MSTVGLTANAVTTGMHTCGPNASYDTCQGCTMSMKYCQVDSTGHAVMGMTPAIALHPSLKGMHHYRVSHAHNDGRLSLVFENMKHAANFASLFENTFSRIFFTAAHPICDFDTPVTVHAEL